MRRGHPEGSVHQKGSARLKGRSALRQIWQDSYNESCSIELHARVDMDGLVKEYADSVLERPARVARKPKVPEPVTTDEVAKAIAKWKEKGYDVSSVEPLLKGEPSSLTIPFLMLKEAIQRAEEVTAGLDALNAGGFEAQVKALRDRLRDPLHHPDLDADLERLRDAISDPGRTDGVAKRPEREVVQRLRPKKAVLTTPSLVDPGLEAQRNGTRGAAGAVASIPYIDGEPNLQGQYTFEAFVVGEANRFACSAASAVAKGSGKTYNPLLITSGPGLGKTHLLHAIGNGRVAEGKDANVLYLTAEAFSNAYLAAKEAASLPAFRTRVRGVDCLLLDDVQFLSGVAEVQEELFHAFNDLHSAGKQIVMASDRPAKAIQDLDERLVSRFESGLVADIRPPDRETRIAILERRAHDVDVEIGAEVLALVADRVEDNVRELGGALNRIVAYSSLMGRPISKELAEEILGGVIPRTLGGPRSGSEGTPTELAAGRSYLVEEERPAAAFGLFARSVAGGHGGLMITRTNPHRVRDALPLKGERILWLTDRESGKEPTIPPVLERIIYELDEFLVKKPGGSLFLDGLEYLISNNSFEAVLKFVRRVVDSVSEGRSIVIMSVGPGTLKDQEIRMLEREMEVLRFE